MPFNTVAIYFPSTSVGGLNYSFLKEENESTSLLGMFINDVQRFLEHILRTNVERQYLIEDREDLNEIVFLNPPASKTEVTIIENVASISRMQINEIEQLRDNWNDNGAAGFSSALIQKTKKIISELPKEPFVSPTACGAIQIEYENESGEYLEFDIYEKKITMFMIDKYEHESEDVIGDVGFVEKMKRVVKAFYECY